MCDECEVCEECEVCVRCVRHVRINCTPVYPSEKLLHSAVHNYVTVSAML